MTKQLNYKEKYEKEQEKLIEQYTHNADTYKQLLEKESLRNEELSKQIEILNKENMQRIFEELKREITENLTAKEEVHKKEILEKQSLMNKEDMKQELIEEEGRKHEYSAETLRKEVSNLQLQIAEFKWEINKTIEDNAEAHRKEVLESKHLMDEESRKQRLLTDNLQEEVTCLKNQIRLTLVYEKPATEQEDVQFTEKFKDSVKKLHHKELNVRDEIHEKELIK